MLADAPLMECLSHTALATGNRSSPLAPCNQHEWCGSDQAGSKSAHRSARRGGLPPTLQRVRHRRSAAPKVVQGALRRVSLSLLQNAATPEPTPHPTPHPTPKPTHPAQPYTTPPRLIQASLPNLISSHSTPHAHTHHTPPSTHYPTHDPAHHSHLRGIAVHVPHELRRPRGHQGTGAILATDCSCGAGALQGA